MSIFDAIDFLDLLHRWRFVVPAAIGAGVGLGVYYLSGEDPAGAAVAFALGLLGVCVGGVWQFVHWRRREWR